MCITAIVAPVAGSTISYVRTSGCQTTASGTGRYSTENTSPVMDSSPSRTCSSGKYSATSRLSTPNSVRRSWLS